MAPDRGWRRSARRGSPRRLGRRLQVELFRTFQFGAAASRTESLFGQAAERRAEVDQGRLVQIEDVGVQVKAVAGGNGEAVQVGHAKDERARPVGQAAGCGAEGFPVRTGGRRPPGARHRAGPCQRRRARRWRSCRLESEPGPGPGNGNGTERTRMWSQCGRQSQRCSCCIMVRHLTLVFRFVDRSRGGCVSPSAPPFLVFGRDRRFGADQ